MALTCTLLGHAFDDYEVVREREERGSEVVTSIREVAVCDRCGAERVLSENTEVTSIVDAPAERTEGETGSVSDRATDDESAEDDRFAPTAVEDATTVDAAPETDATDAVEVDSDGGDGAEIVADEADRPDVGGLDDVADDADVAGGASSEETTADAGVEGSSAGEQHSEADDDAIILTDDPEQREYGEWPSHDGQQYRPWDPDRLLDDPDAEDDDGPTVAEVMGNGTSGEADEEDDGPEFEETATNTGETTFHCPDCGFETPAGAVSLRAGDVCPDCRTGYLVAERNP